MGTQQIILILLAILIIGISIAVGLQIFTKYHKSNVQKAAILDMKSIAQMVIEWWKTSENNGGSGYKNPISSDDLNDIKRFITFPRNESDFYVSENGTYNVTITGSQEVTIAAETQYSDVSPVIIVSLADNTQELQ